MVLMIKMHIMKMLMLILTRSNIYVVYTIYDNNGNYYDAPTRTILSIRKAMLMRIDTMIMWITKNPVIRIK